MLDKKIIKFPVKPETEDQGEGKKENPFNVDPGTGKPRRGGMGGCVVFGTAYHGPDGEADEVELETLGRGKGELE